MLLVGPYDPSCGEYTFLSPPLGVWRLAGVLDAAGFPAQVFDPNCCAGPPEQELRRTLQSERWDVVGFSTTGMTLRYDLGLAHLARAVLPRALLVAGGMEATFSAQQVLELGPFDLVVLGEGEKPLQEIGAALRDGRDPRAVSGIAWLAPDGQLQTRPRPALTRDELRDANFATPYERMPYREYWRRLEERYRVGDLPVKAAREARLAEIRSVRLITLNYCPMACSFCSSTSFLSSAQGSTARIARLDAEECLAMLERIVRAYPEVRCVIFQDDIFTFTSDARLLPLCAGIVAAKQRGELPAGLQFISTNRIDAMTKERLQAMRTAGFRVLGFGVENFSPRVLQEFNKGRIFPHIEPMLSEALRLGITPFLDTILTSPRSQISDFAETVRQCFRWILAGSEVGTYPYVIPFSGAAMAQDPSLREHTIREQVQVPGTGIRWQQATKILPIDPATRSAILETEASFEASLKLVQAELPHLPSRVRSLLWILSAVSVLSGLGEALPSREAVLAELIARLPLQGGASTRLHAALSDAPAIEVAV